MDTNKKNKETRTHQPQATTPANIKSGDKLRENPANDEETISQKPKEHYGDRNAQSQLSREHEKGTNQVTNQEEQKEVTNPEGGDWDKPETDDPTPRKNPYEEISDNPGDTQKKIPKL